MWNPIFIKDFGFFSPVNEQGRWITTAYRMISLIACIAAYRSADEFASKTIAALSAFVVIAAVYYAYAYFHREENRG